MTAKLTDGERWTRAQLALGRAGGWRPGAVAAFLAAARERSADDRRARPELTRQARRWSAVGGAAWLAGAALGPGPLRRRLVPGLAGWTATAALLDWHLGMVQTVEGELRPLGPADAATLARVWLAPVAAERAAPAVLLAGFATDVADGALARRSAPTRFGRDFDGEADAVFVAAATLGAYRSGHLPGWAAAAEVAWLGVGVARAVTSYFGGGAPPSSARAAAARTAGPLRAAGLLATGAGHRAGGLLVLAGIAASAAAMRRVTIAA